MHQENIEKIEHIQNWCKNLKILLLQNNLISKIENVQKLRKLEYLNLAVNNIEKIENLDQLESLEKLDLTLNFIGDLFSIKNLRPNYGLRDLILTGNYCCDYDGYRHYVIHTLPQLKSLDGIEIKASDRILAAKHYDKSKVSIERHQLQQQKRRDEQKKFFYQRIIEDAIENEKLTADEINERFWKRKSEHCPETRVEMAQQQQRMKSNAAEEKKLKPQRKLFAENGRPYCLNEPKIDFKFDDTEHQYTLDVHVFK